MMIGVSASVNLPLHHKSLEVLFWHRLTQVVLEKWPLNSCGVVVLSRKICTQCLKATISAVEG